MSVLTKAVWGLSEDDFPETDPIETQLGFLLRYAILAPSTKNTQPWAFSIQGNRIHVIADLSRGQSIADRDRRELYISLGCALENLLVAAEHFGLHHAVSYFPEPRQEQLAATVTFERGGVPSQARVGATVDAIRRRHNDNSVFRTVPVPDQLRARLMACCVEPDLRILLTDDRHFHRWIDVLTMEADRVDFVDAAMRATRWRCARQEPLRIYSLIVRGGFAAHSSQALLGDDRHHAERAQAR